MKHFFRLLFSVLVLAAIAGCAEPAKGDASAEPDEMSQTIKRLLDCRRQYVSTHPEVLEGFDSATRVQIQASYDTADMVWASFYGYCLKGDYDSAAHMLENRDDLVWLRIFWKSSDLVYLFHRDVMAKLLLDCQDIDRATSISIMVDELELDVSQMSFLVNEHYEPEFFDEAVNALAEMYVEEGMMGEG